MSIGSGRWEPVELVHMVASASDLYQQLAVLLITLGQLIPQASFLVTWITVMAATLLAHPPVFLLELWDQEQEREPVREHQSRDQDQEQGQEQEPEPDLDRAVEQQARKFATPLSQSHHQRTRFPQPPSRSLAASVAWASVVPAASRFRAVFPPTARATPPALCSGHIPDPCPPYRRPSRS